jgi:hypothetical protein
MEEAEEVLKKAEAREEAEARLRIMGVTARNGRN